MKAPGISINLWLKGSKRSLVACTYDGSGVLVQAIIISMALDQTTAGLLPNWEMVN
jgi:hypothetical protein